MSQVRITKRLADDKKQLIYSEDVKIENTFFQWYDQAREKYQWKTWVVAVIEFIGTFLMTFMIIAPATFGLYSAETYGNSDFGQVIEEIFSFMFMRALWVAMGIWVLIILFNKISVNLNPAITISEMAAHNHLRAQGVVKILAQVSGGIVASYIALYLGIAWMGEVNSLDSIILGTHNFYQPNADVQLGFMIDSKPIVLADHQAYIAVQFFMEFILTFLLLLAVFATDHVNWSLRSWILALALLVLVSIGIRTDNVALNPARLIGPAMASATYNLNHAGAEIDAAALTALPLILIAELSAALLMYFIQGAMKTKFENRSTVKKDEIIQLAWAKILALEVIIDDGSVNKKTLYEMSSKELYKKAKNLGIDKIEDVPDVDLIDKISFVLIKKYLNSKLIAEQEEAKQKTSLVIDSKELLERIPSPIDGKKENTIDKESKVTKSITKTQTTSLPSTEEILEKRIEVITRTIINTNTK